MVLLLLYYYIIIAKIWRFTYAVITLLQVADTHTFYLLIRILIRKVRGSIFEPLTMVFSDRPDRPSRPV